MDKTSVLKVKVKQEEEKGYEEVHSEDFLRPEVAKLMPVNEIVQTYITTIDLTKRQGLVEVKLEIFKKNDWWKSGWYFEGLVLEPVTGPGQEEQPIPAVPEESSISTILY